MANPKIIYDPGSGPVTLTFLRPARKVAADNILSVRHDNLSSAGVRESLYERADNFLEFEIEWLGIGADVVAWRAFMQYALKGGQFSYYPDASLAVFTNYWLEDTSYVPGYKVPEQYTFKVKLRQVVT